jgi:hypothetical protein
MRPETLGARIGVAAAGVLLLGFGGAGAFALTGSLPGGNTGPALPDVASATAAAHVPAQVPVTDGDDGAEDDEPEDEAGDDGATGPKTVPTSAVGPDATGPAAFGLCNAWSHAKDSKKTAEHSVAFRNLVKAAGGVDRVDGYCATVEHPSARAGDKAKDKGKGHGNGSADSKGKSATGKPSTAPGKGPQDKSKGQQGGQGKGRQAPATTSPSTSG